MLQKIINPFAYVVGDEHTKLTDSISNSLEPICRQLLYALHNKRYALLKSAQIYLLNKLTANSQQYHKHISINLGLGVHMVHLNHYFQYFKFYSNIFYVVLDSSHYRVNNNLILSGGGLYIYYVVEDS